MKKLDLQEKENSCTSNDDSYTENDESSHQIVSHFSTTDDYSSAYQTMIRMQNMKIRV